MALPLSPQTPTLLVVFTCFLRLAAPFTVIVPDSSGPSALVDAPQTGFSMNAKGARTDTREQEAVYDIMKATGNQWATDIPDVCRGRWHGIECMPDKDNVYHVVSLSFGALSDDTAFPTCDPVGSYISPSVTKLPHLRTLFFYRCFSYNPQPLPPFLGRLGPTLQTLVLRENGHVGTIPNELCNLTRLKVLDLHKNNLNGSIPVQLGRITGLRSLDLSGNRLTGPIPSVTFRALNILDLGQNLLTGPIPSSLATCRSLIKIDFSHNRLSGPIPEPIQELKGLMLMDLSYNRLSGPIPRSIKNLDSLQVLILKGNFMGGSTTILPSDVFDGLKSLMVLILSNMNLHGPIPESLGRVPNLRVAQLDGNRLNGSIPTSFRELRYLSELRLNDNQLSGSVPFGRDMVWRMKRKLRLGNNLGLCYDSGKGFEDGFDSGTDSDIGLCETPSPGGLERTVKHISDLDGNVRSENASSGVVCKSSVFVGSFLTIFVLLI